MLCGQMTKLARNHTPGCALLVSGLPSFMLHLQVLKLAQDLGSLQRQVAQGQAAQLSYQKVGSSDT